MVRDGSLSMGMPGGSMAVPFTAQTDYFVTLDRAPRINPPAGPNSVNTSVASMLSPQMAERIRAVTANMKGFVMRSVARTSSTIMGTPMGATQTTEVEHLQEATVAPIAIAVPVAYTKSTLTARMRSASSP